MSKAQVIHKLGPPLPRGGKPTPRRPTPGPNPSVLECRWWRPSASFGRTVRGRPLWTASAAAGRHCFAFLMYME